LGGERTSPSSEARAAAGVAAMVTAATAAAFSPAPTIGTPRQRQNGLYTEARYRCRRCPLTPPAATNPAPATTPIPFVTPLPLPPPPLGPLPPPPRWGARLLPLPAPAPRVVVIISETQIEGGGGSSGCGREDGARDERAEGRHDVGCAWSHSGCGGQVVAVGTVRPTLRG
jgi:hypothetical protein